MKSVLEDAGPQDSVLQAWLKAIESTQTFHEMVNILSEIFKVKPSDAGQDPPDNPTEYRDEDSDFGLRVRGKKAREDLNQRAREIIDRVREPSELSDEDREVLRQYSGRGGLTENSQFEYYTPVPVADGVWDALQENGFVNGNVLEPSAGAGVFSATKPRGCIITGTEIDPVASRVNQLLHPEDTIFTQGFERLAVDVPDDTYDAVVGNVPFGGARGATAHDDPAHKNEKRIERYFILRTIDKVKPGGLICLVVPINIVGAKGKQWEQFRIAVSKKAEFLGAHKLPSKTFANQGTDTVVDVIVLQKHSRDLLDRIDEIPIESLKEANVIYDEFIKGQWWLGEGKRFIMGTYVPKVAGDRWSRETVDGKIYDATLRKNLARKFSSRIDWATLDAAAPIVRNYTDGDRKNINGREYEMAGGVWEPVIHEKMETHVIDADKFGARTIEDLKAVLESPRGALSLTAANVLAIHNNYPELLTQYQKDAIKHAMSQPNPEYHEQVYRGSIIGSMMARYDAEQKTPDADQTVDLDELRELVTNEIDKYGHPKNNKGLMTAGEWARGFGMFANAIDERGGFCDLLAGTLQRAQGTLQFDSTNPRSIVEHLFFREGFTVIELEDVQRLYEGSKPITSLGDIPELDPGIAVTPDGFILPMSRYACGDFAPKIVSLNQALAEEQDPRLIAQYQRQLEEIDRRRTKVGADSIQYGLQQKWFSKKYIVEFLKENGYPHIKYGRVRIVEGEDYDGKPTKKSVFVEDYDDPFGEFRGHGKEDYFDKQFLRYLNGGKITSSKEEHLQSYRQQARAMEENFDVFMQQHEDSDDLVETYNLRFNGFIPFEYDESDLGLVGVSGKVKPHGFQNAAIRRLSEEGRGCLAFDVGLGKTFSALGLVAYNHQMGRSKKTCIVVPKAVLANWYHESNMFFGDMNNVLYVGFDPKKDKAGNNQMEPVLDENGNHKINKHTGEPEYQTALKEDSPEDIYRKMWQIPTTNLRVVVMTKEKFGAIPMRPTTKDGFVKEMLERQLISDRDAVTAVTGDDKPKMGKRTDKTTYADAVKQDRYRQQFADEGTQKKGEFPYYEDMGFDSVIIDEAHDFKNVYQRGEETGNIAYLPSAPVAKRALDMNLKLHHLRKTNGGRGPYLLTATPVTNSPLEIYSMLSHVMPVEEFERFGVRTIDDFVRVFGRIEPVMKVKVSGEVGEVEGVTGFKNLDGLRSIFHKYVNMKDATDVNLPLPPHTETNETVDMTEAQKELYANLREEAKEAAKPGSGISMFSIIRNMDRVTTDLDLYHKTMTFVFPKSAKAQVDALVGDLPVAVTIDVVEEGERSKQEVSLEIQRRDQGDSHIMIIPESFESHVVTRLKQFGIEPSTVAHPVMPKYAKLIENAKREIEAGGKQIVFTEEKTQHQKLRRILVHHLPVTEDQVLIINADTADGDNLQNIADAYNSGKAKIVIANKKAEVGVNLQNGTTAIHHLTLPWTPASIQQRNGRGVRQGNTAAHISVYYYLGRGSFDEFRLEQLRAKSNWMRDLFDGKEATADNANALESGDYMDLLESDPEAAKRLRLEKIEKKKEQERERTNRLLTNTYQQLASMASELGTLDERKAKERESLEQSIKSADFDLKNLDYRLGTAEDEQEKAKIREKLSKTTSQRKGYVQRLGGLDEKYEKRKSDLEARVKQKSGLLRAKAKKEGLPFSPDLVEHPANGMVLMDGRVIAVGDYYEFTDSMGRNDEYGFWYTGDIIKITKVDATERSYAYEAVKGPSARPKEKKFPPATHVKRVSYSESELAMLRLLDRQWTFEDLVKGELPRDLFNEHFEKIQWQSYAHYLMRPSWQSGLSLITGREINNEQRVVYPDKNDETFRKEVCELYLSMERNEDGNIRGLRLIMDALFGREYKQVAAQYGRMATEPELRAILADYLDTWFKQNIGQENMAQDDAAPFVANRFERWINSIYPSAYMKAVKEAGYDNIQDEVFELFQSMTIPMLIELKAKARAEEERQKQAEEAKIKADPNYKEIPVEVIEKFKEINMIVRYNTTKLVLSGKGKFRDVTIEPFERLFLHDTRGKNGRLFRQKDVLKARFKAQFCSDPPGNDLRDGSAWWHVPATVTPEEIYKLLS